MLYIMFFIEQIFMLYIPLDSEFQGLSYYFFQFFVKSYDNIRFWEKFFFIELIYMLNIPLDSEFEGLSYEGTLFFPVFCENI